MSAVKQADVDSAIKSVEFTKLGKKTTVGIATLVNGFEIVESSSCVDEKKYNQEMGEKIVRERIDHKIWELLGFKSQDTNATKTPGQEPAKISEEQAFEED